jgi:class 3 adenylate cyclase/pimeloyl-ACP methyl ester carboxylesterase
MSGARPQRRSEQLLALLGGEVTLSHRFGYAPAADGAYIAYDMVGNGPVDFVWQGDGYFGVIDMWRESPMWADWFLRLAEFSRVILIDKRSTGFSSRDFGVPNLERRVSDLVTVLDVVGADRAVLGGFFEGATPGVILAATQPHRVHSLYWVAPKARGTWAADYPWGVTPEQVVAEQSLLAAWGTDDFARLFIDHEASSLGHEIGEQWIDLLNLASRRTCTPEVARESAMVWYETDVRAALPAVQAPALLIDTGNARELSDEISHIASLMTRGEILRLAEDPDQQHVDAVRRLVGADPAPPDLARVLATVMFTDIVDSTARAAALGDSGWRNLRERHDQAVRQTIEKYQGREVKTMGDGFLVTFDGPSRAVHCAETIVRENRSLGIEVRAGLHIGEIELDGDDVAGIAVAIGARVAAVAGPSEVLVSQTIKDLTAGSGIAFVDRGEHELKGVPDRWRLYQAVS